MRRRVTCYFVWYFIDGSVSSPIKRTLTVVNNSVTTKINSNICRFFVPDTGDSFIYRVSIPEPLVPNSMITPAITSQTLYSMLDTSFMETLTRVSRSLSLIEKIFGRKCSRVEINSTKIVLDITEKSGVVKGDFIIFSRKMWEELKTK